MLPSVFGRDLFDDWFDFPFFDDSEMRKAEKHKIQTHTVSFSYYGCPPYT